MENGTIYYFAKRNKYLRGSEGADALRSVVQKSVGYEDSEEGLYEVLDQGWDAEVPSFSDRGHRSDDHVRD